MKGTVEIGQYVTEQTEREDCQQTHDKFHSVGLCADHHHPKERDKTENLHKRPSTMPNYNWLNLIMHEVSSILVSI